MSDLQPDLLEKIRQQFDNSPYPRIPLDHTPQDDAGSLYIHNLVTSFYLRDGKVINPAGKVILDAGCGSGYKSLILAEANPGAKVVGIDLSAESVKLAEQRLKHHGFDHAEFHALSIDDLASLNQQFDYINCDEVLYLLPDPIAGLKAMRSVLKPDGIIRANLHSSMQRFMYFRGQEFFKLIGLTGDSDQALEIATVRETMSNLKDNVLIKMNAWKPIYETDDERVLANYLLRGDKGFTIPEFFAVLETVGLEFISMVQWQQWNLLDLFEDIGELPIDLAMNLADRPIKEQLRLFELFQPIHRLLDLWCGHPQPSTYLPIGDWQDADWQRAQVHLHPQLKTPAVKADLIACIPSLEMFELSKHLPMQESVQINSLLAACLLPLWEAPQPFEALVKRWIALRPLDPATLEPTIAAEAFEFVKQSIAQLETSGYLLLELLTNTTYAD